MVILVPLKFMVGVISINISPLLSLLFNLRKVKLKHYVLIIVLILYSLFQMTYTNASYLSLLMLIKLALLYIVGFKLNLKFVVFIWSYIILALAAVIEFILALYYNTFSAFTFFPRVSSFFMPINIQDFGSAFDPNNFGIYLVLLFIILKRRFNYDVPLLFLLVPVILTGSKIAFILTLVVVWRYHFRYLVYATLLLAVMSITESNIILPELSDKLRLLDYQGQSDRSTEDRWDRIVNNAYQISPVEILAFGAGFEALRYKKVGQDYQRMNNLSSNSHYNQFLAILYDFGALGGLVVLILLLFVFLKDRFLFICFILLGLTGEYFYNEMIAIVCPSLFFYDTAIRKIFI